MASSKSSNKSSGGNIVGLITTVAGAAVALAPMADKITDEVKNRLPQKIDKKEFVSIPALCDKSFPLKLEQAVEILTDVGLKAIPSEVLISEAGIRYKNCFDTQVVDSKPKSKQKVAAGTPVLLRYVTQEVISESQRIFSEAEAHKAEVKREKVTKRDEQRERVKEFTTGVADRAKAGITSIGKIIPTRTTKQKEQENDEPASE